MPKKETKEELIGEITHYFAKIKVAVVKIKKKTLEVGDKIHIKGATTDFEQPVKSMQVDHKDVEKAKKGDDVGMKVKKRVREGDEVYKI
ncbi:MAG: translation elongation factor-like protein [Candidatus Portnoybacteria bacterium]|nr:translation elongation factor-like protein [Candidatus Portnoybacteria bacterium]